MSNWEKRIIGNAISFNPSESLERGTVAPKIPMGNLTEHQRKIDGYELAEYKSGPKFRNGDTLMAKITPCLENGKTAQVDILEEDELAFGSSEFIVLRATEFTTPDYVYYLSISPTFRKKAISCMEGTSGRKRVNYTSLKNFELPFPTIDEQSRITRILKTIDEKIELNKKINKELESMAKLIYDYWFVQFDFPISKEQAEVMGKPELEGKPYKSSGGKMVYNKLLKRKIPEGWDSKFVGNVIRTELGGTPSTKVKEFWEGDIPWLSSGEVESFPVIDSEAFITNIAIEKSATSLMPSGTCAISITRHLRPTILAVDACANQSVVGLYESEDLKSSYIYPFLKNEIPRFMSLRTGAQQPHINKGIIYNSPILIPPNSVLKNYYSIVDDIYNRIILSAFESKKLTELRDWLLPMLINGQITVKETEEEFSIAAEPVTENKATKKPTNVDYYRRTVLAAEIVWQLHRQPTLGHVKLQKIIYLAQQTSNMVLPTNFLKQAAGPYDPQMARSLDKQLKKKKWFEFQKDEFPKYKPLENAGEHSADFNKYFQNEKENIQFFIDTFKKAKTDKVEIIATLYACWKEFIEEGKAVTDDVLIEQFYNWSEEKARFKQERLEKAINWMRDEGVYPVS